MSGCHSPNSGGLAPPWFPAAVSPRLASCAALVLSQDWLCKERAGHLWHSHENFMVSIELLGNTGNFNSVNVSSP